MQNFYFIVFTLFTANAFGQCPTVLSEIETTSPVTVNNIIEICPNDSVTFTAVFDPNYNYTWDFESLGTQTGRTVTQQFNESGGYFIRLLTTDQNACPSDPVDYVTVVVSEDPDINYDSIDAPVICLGDSLDIIPESSNAPILVCNDADFVAGTTFLPDGSGVSYETSINIDCFPDGSVLNNTTSFLGVCMNIEHSYAGDLDIELIAPDGTVLTLLFNNFGGNVFLGEPIDDDNDLSPGIGYDYCFTTDALESFANATSGNTTIPAGDYSTSDPFSNLLGVPLNGTWSLRITDNLLIDNGYIFSWFIKFGANIESTTGYTSPTITSESWATHPDITVLSTGGVTITPSQTGFNCYDYTTIDSSGCTFTDQYCIEVRDPQTDFPTVDLYIYDSDANGTEDFNLDFNTDRLIGNMDAATTTVTYYNTLADAQNQSNPIFNTDSFANTTNPQTIYASVNNSNLLCQNVIVDFDLILTNQPVTDSDNDTIPDLSEDLNGNGDLTDDDTDGDGIPNYLDDDDDGDGVPTAVETSGVGARGTNFTFIDTDGDGIENYLDNDDDGDGVFTEDEDYNGNGDPTDDDTDGSGIPDFLESTVTLSIDSITRDAFVIYPNPFYENNFEIRYSNSNNNTLKATLYNMNGASVLTKSYPINESGIIKVETPNLTSGIYFLQLNTNQNSVYKLIKK
ncbi:MAG: T9SS type A sorting domain-containing protein [Nonlabens sp.]|uniref:T9SS type A sorting domain-containing protein n=4 Tax=Nonlabens sp. TaxID=1888209 RepID=UPI00321B9525